MRVEDADEQRVINIIRRCRFCNSPLEHTFVDLGVSPLANSYISAKELAAVEAFYPLHVYVCSSCFLVQVGEIKSPKKIFSDYAYFSSYSDSWLKHSSAFAHIAIEQYGLNSSSMVVEIGSNDGYLLNYFFRAGIPVLGIEPAYNVAAVAQSKGLNTITRFFNKALAKELVKDGLQADLLVGNNVLAHIPDINDFVAGLKILLKPKGVISMEFPHLLTLIKEVQFDTIYHEHYSYFSLSTVLEIFNRYDLEIFNCELVKTHGGSLRISACHKNSETNRQKETVKEILEYEQKEGLKDLAVYETFNDKVRKLKRSILSFLIQQKDEDKFLAAYGAPAKGNTLLNYCGIGTDFISFTVDRNPHKQGFYLPGSRIPIYKPKKVFDLKPDYLIILPWNLKDEIMDQMADIRSWGGQFVTLVPKVDIY